VVEKLHLNTNQRPHFVISAPSYVSQITRKERKEFNLRKERKKLELRNGAF